MRSLSDRASAAWRRPRLWPSAASACCCSNSTRCPAGRRRRSDDTTGFSRPACTTSAGWARRAGPEGQFRRLLESLGDGTLQFAPCANPYDIVRLPGFTFGIPHPESAYRAALNERFPGEAVAIHRWFDACHAARKAGFALMAAHNLPAWIGWGLRLLRTRQLSAWAQRTLADELASIAQPQLRAVLGARWADYGAPPQTAPFIEHAWVTGAYDGGAYYPVGGPHALRRRCCPPCRWQAANAASAPRCGASSSSTGRPWGSKWRRVAR